MQILKNRAKQTASTPNKYGGGKKETTTNKDGSVTATGKVGMNMLRTGVTAVMLLDLVLIVYVLLDKI